MKWGLQFDRINQPNATWGYNGTMRYNVVWTTSGMRMKGDDHHCYNNLAFDNEQYFDLCLFGYPGDGVKGENSHTVTENNNIRQNGACSATKNPQCQYDLSGKYTNNVKGSIRDILRDTDNFDFCPNPDSGFGMQAHQFWWASLFQFRRYCYFQKQPNFPFRPWTIVHGHQKI